MQEHLVYIDKPWGFFEQFAMNEQCTVKILHVNPGASLSRQYHKSREELWVVLDEGMVVELGKKVIKPAKGERIFIPKGVTHRLSSKAGGRVLELSTGFFDESDIVRLEDRYGRA